MTGVEQRMSETKRTTGRAPWIFATVLGAVAVVLAVVLVVGNLPERHRTHTFTAQQYGALTATEQQAVEAAKQVVINTLTYSRTTFNADFARTLAGTTGALKSDISKDKATVLKTMTAGKFDLTGTVSYAAFDAQNGSDYVVLVTAVGNKVTTKGSTPASNARLMLTMSKIDGKWLASDLTSVGLT
jgi:hypothetical protein